jgi:fibronectin-binding autotransporter adhesin
MKSTFKPQSLLLAAAACLVLCAATGHAGVVTNIFTFQQGNLQTNGVAYGSGASYSGVVDGSITDNSGTSARTTSASSTIGNQYNASSPNGQTWCGLFSYDLTELNNFITANTGVINGYNSSVAVQSVSLQIVSAGGVSGTASTIRLYGTDPFTSSGCTWSNYTTATPWTAPFQNIASSAQYGYTGGASVLTGSLGGSNPNTGIASGSPLTWTSSSNFIAAVTNALARTDKKLYLTANVAITAYAGGSDQRLNVNYSPAATVANRPALTITLQITTTAAPEIWTGASGTSWATAGNWSPSGIPGTDAPIIFDTPSTANLSTLLNQNFTIASLSVTNPTGSVSIGGANSLTIDAGGINLSAATKDVTISAPVILGLAQTWNVTNTHTLSVNGGVSGSVALTVSGGGKVSLGGAATYTGDTIVSSGGTLQLGADNVLPNLAGGGNMNDNGVLDLNGHPEAVNGLNGSGVVDNTAIGTATLTVGNNNTNSSFSGKLQNTGGALALVKTGAGSLTLSASNTYSGGTTIASGTVTPGNGAVFGTGTVTIFGSAYAAASMTITNPLVLNEGYLHVGGGSDTVIWSGPVTVTNGFLMGGDNNGNVNNVSGPIDIGTGGIYVTNVTGNGQAQAVLGDILSGTISGSGGITYYMNGGNSRLTVQGANTYSGSTIVNGTSNGKLNVYGGNHAFSTGSVTLNPGAVIESYPGNATITNALTLNGGILEGESQYNDYNRLTWAGPITLTANSTLYQFGQSNTQMSQGVNVSGPLNMNGYTLTNGGNSGLYSGSIISGSISGAGNILETVNILYLQGSNTFSGTFRSVGGNITLQNVNAMQNATLDMNAADGGSVTLMNGAVIGSLMGSRNLNLGGFTVLIGNNNASTTFSGALTNTGSMTKVGSGTLTLSGANSYTGRTTVSSGTLALSGAGSLGNGNISVAGGATLDVSAATIFTLASGQVLSNSASATANLVGPVNTGSGTISVSFVNGTPSFNVGGGSLNLSASTVVAIDNTGAALTPGTYLVVSKSGTGTVAGTVPTSVSVVNGPSAGTPTLAIVGGQLYLTVGGSSSIGYTATGPFTYNGAAHSPTANVSGSTGAQTATYVGVSVGYGPSGSTPVNVGTYYVSNTVAADANYYGATNSQTFTIAPLGIAVSANAQAKVYGGADPALTYMYAPALVGGDSFSGALSRAAGESVGTYAINQGTLSLSANYSITYTNGSLTVNPAALLVKADNQSRSYGVTNPVLTVSYIGFVNSETLGTSDIGGVPALTTTADTNSSVGTYTITTAIGSLSSTNYSFVFSNGTLTVVQANTSVGLVSSENPAGYKDAVTYQSVLPTDATGSVVFSSASGLISTNSLSGGTATSLSVTNLPRGTNLITVAYVGDSNYLGSTNTLNQIVTNHPPVAGNLACSRSVSVYSLRLAVSDILTNVTDGDADSITLISVGTSTNGIVPSVSGGWVSYTNTNGVNDQFSYTVTDGLGGTNTGTVYITVNSTPLFGQSQVAGVSGGTATLQFAGIPTYSYSVLRSTNLIDWSALWTTNAPTGGVFQFIDGTAPEPSAYYQLRYNP